MHFLVSARSHDPEKMSFNFSSHDLSDDEKSLLCKGLNFSIPPKRLDYADHMLPFEFLFSDIDEKEMPNEVKEFLKIRLKDSALTSFQSYNYNSEINLTRNERLALNNLSNNKNISFKNLTRATLLSFLTKTNTLKECPKY